MARVIQEHIKKGLADEVLFGKLKNGGHVRVVVVKDENGADKLGFDYPAGPVAPKPEKIPEKKKRRSPTKRSKPSGPRGGGEGPSSGGSSRGSVPKVPLVKA
jgi:ATP-dependent Clp protease ATP-binding subunit ClpA